MRYEKRNARDSGCPLRLHGTLMIPMNRNAYAIPTERNDFCGGEMR